MKDQNKKLYTRRKALSVAIAAIVPVLVVAANAHAAGTCAAVSPAANSTSGVNVDGLGCTGGNAIFTNASGTTIGNPGATATGASVWMEGVGNTIDNDGTITRSSTAGHTYGVFVGDYSVARNSSDSVAVTGGAGATTMRITVPAGSLTAASQLVGKKILMAGSVVDGEARPGDLRTISTATLVSGGTYDITVSGKGWTKDQAGNKYNLLAGSGSNTVNNRGTISAVYTGTATANARALETNIAGDYVINNLATGIISATHTSVGTPQGIDAGGDVTTMTVNNDGAIIATRANSIALTANSFDSLKATGGGIANQNLGSGAAIYSQEELEAITINNNAGGQIVGEGQFTPAIYMRAGEQSVVNEGEISGSRMGSVGSYTYGMAIGSVSDGGEIRTLILENKESGKINGDILAVNANAYRWYALSNFDSAGGADPAHANLDNRLKTNGSNWGQLDSSITNDGMITGGMYFGNGTHVLANTGTMMGNIDLDQRDTRCVQANSKSAGCAPGTLGENARQTGVVEVVSTAGSKDQIFNVYNVSVAAGDYSTDVTGLSVASTDTKVNSLATVAAADGKAYTGLFTVVGTKSFTFENAGEFTGDILLHTASSNVLGHTVTSAATFVPTITGAGSTDVDAPNTTNIKRYNGVLTVVSTAAAGGALGDVTIAPRAASGTIIRDGQFYQVFNQVKTGTTLGGVTSLTSASAGLPSVVGNGLVNWTAHINTAGALVVESEVNAANVTGVSGSASNALAALMNDDSVLGSVIQNLANEDDVRKAAEQIRPEINGAGIQAALGVTDKVLGLVDSHLAETHLAQLTGKSGIATGDQPNGTGVWLQGFGARGDQDRRKGVDGYTADAYGFAMGADTLLNAGTRIGAALSYGQSNIDDRGVNAGNRTDIDSYQASVYGSMLMDGWYLNGTLGLGRHNYDSRRLVLGNVVNGRHDAWQYTAKVDAGWPMKAGSAILTPVASLTYSRLNQDGYNETGIGALAIGRNDTDSFRSGLGARALIPLSEGGLKTALELRAIWSHEFGDTQQDTTAGFVGGGSSFTTRGVSVARDGLNLGGSLALAHADGIVQQNLLLSYDAEVKDQYLSHTARLQARFDF